MAFSIDERKKEDELFHERVGFYMEFLEAEVSFTVINSLFEDSLSLIEVEGTFLRIAYVHHTR